MESVILASETNLIETWRKEGKVGDIQKSTVPPAVTEAVALAFSAFLLQMISPVVYAVGEMYPLSVDSSYQPAMSG